MPISGTDAIRRCALWRILPNRLRASNENQSAKAVNCYCASLYVLCRIANVPSLQCFMEACFFVFYVLSLEGYDIRNNALIERKAELK